MDPTAKLLAVRECEALMYRYASLIDSGSASSVADLFTTGGVWESAENTMTGQQAIAQGFRARQANEGRRSRHVCSNVVVTVVSPTEAEGHCYFTLYRADDVVGDVAPLDGPVMVGDYADRFELVGERWKIAHRTATIAFIARAGGQG